tara:strand:+ start:782 stop:1384 length:603 start_codon:yes stop_codon:yes gene_type:complete
MSVGNVAAASTAASTAGATAGAGIFGSMGTALAAAGPVGWVMAGLGVINYFSARKKQQRMRERLAPIAQSQMSQIKSERGDIVKEYKGMAESAVKTGDIAMSQMASARATRLGQAKQQIGQANLKYATGNLQAENLLTAYNQQMQLRAEQTGQQVVGIQNRLAGELRGLDASALQLKSMYAQQGIGLNYNMTNVDQLKYV